MNIAIIQARVNSNRLPGKVLMPLIDKTIIEHIIDRVFLSKKIDQVYVATGYNKLNNSLLNICWYNNFKNDLRTFIGDEDNVLKRYCDLIRNYRYHDNDNIIRITADCPLVCPEMIDDMLIKMGDKEYYTNQDYCLDGCDIEIIKAGVLLAAEKKYQFDEHVTLKWKQDNDYEEYIYGNKDLSKVHLSLDTIDDFWNIKAIYDELYLIKPDFGYDDIMGVIE